MVRVWLIVFIALFETPPLTCHGEPSSTPNYINSRIPRESVQSTAIATVGYSKRRHILEIEFVNGAIYRYAEVPASFYRALMSAKSKAQFYDRNIRGKFHSIHVRPRTKG